MILTVRLNMSEKYGKKLITSRAAFQQTINCPACTQLTFIYFLFIGYPDVCVKHSITQPKSPIVFAGLFKLWKEYVKLSRHIVRSYCPCLLNQELVSII